VPSLRFSKRSNKTLVPDEPPGPPQRITTPNPPGTHSLLTPGRGGPVQKNDEKNFGSRMSYRNALWPVGASAHPIAVYLSI
jgi:hypothetical protein